MASVKKITMHEYNGTDYDTLYPKTIASQVDGVYNKTEVDTLLANKAPAGYGLGVGAKILTSDDDLNNIWKPGYYSFHTSSMPKNAPDIQGMTADLFFLNVSGTQDTCFIQEVSPVTDGTGNTAVLNNKIVRSAYSTGTISPWEWVNPPMNNGVEYRTTERYLGKPVYAKIVNCGESIAASDSFIDIPSGISDYDSTVALNVRAGEFSLPAYYSGGSPMGNTYIDAFMYGSTIRFRSGWNLSRNIYAFIKYTKTTD